MKKIKIILVLFLALLFVGCGEEEKTPEPGLPADTIEFLAAVDKLEFTLNCKEQLEEAFALYEALGEDSWNYDEVLDAFDMLVQMEKLLKEYEDAAHFISLVDDIPVIITIDDKTKIDAAKLAYELLKDSSKNFLDVNIAYTRLEEAIDIYEALEVANKETNDQLMAIEFINLTKQIPSLSIFVYEDIKYVEAAESYYLTLSDNAKVMNEVVEAYKKVTDAREHYKNMENDPSIYDEIIIVRFIELVSNIPAVSDITLDSLSVIEAAEENYRELSQSAREEQRVIEANSILQAARAKYNELLAAKEEQEKEEALIQQIAEFKALIDELPNASDLTKEDGQQIADARYAYDALPGNVKQDSEIVAAYEKIVELEEKYKEFKSTKITFSFYNLISSGGTAPNVVLQGAELTFYSGLKQLYGVSSNEDLAKAVDLYVYIYFANETEPENYVIYGDIENVLANCSNVISYATIIGLLQEASKTNPEVVSGAYKFGVKVIDRKNLYADSDIFVGTGVVEYSFNSLYDDGNDDAPTDVIEISNKEQFLAIKDNLSGTYVLIADIDLEGMEWENLGKFAGTLDGRGHKITNMAHSNGGDAVFGIFLEILAGAKVSRIVLEGTVADAGAWAGAICVRNYGIIENCIINLDVTALGEAGHIGGISTDNNGIITNCLVLSKIDAQGTLWGSCTGNLVINNNGTIQNTYACKDNSMTDKIIHANNGQSLSSGSYSLSDLKNSSLYSNWDASIWQITNGELPTLIIE